MCKAMFLECLGMRVLCVKIPVRCSTGQLHTASSLRLKD